MKGLVAALRWVMGAAVAEAASAVQGFGDQTRTQMSPQLPTLAQQHRHAPPRLCLHSPRFRWFWFSLGWYLQTPPSPHPQFLLAARLFRNCPLLAPARSRVNSPFPPTIFPNIFAPPTQTSTPIPNPHPNTRTPTGPV